MLLSISIKNKITSLHEFNILKDLTKSKIRILRIRKKSDFIGVCS